jgi:hypothetical protein
MIISKCFNNDYNETLINVQFDLYFLLVRYFFEFPKQRYLKSAGLLNINTAFVKKLRETSSFDHRIFQPVHDLIAAYYRYNYPKLIEDNQHGHLLFQNEVFHITDTENTFVLASLKAVMENDEESINEMVSILHRRYDSDEWLIS